MRQLTLFKNFTPNQEGGLHYFLNRPDLFTTRFAEYLEMQLQDNNFRINGNILKIKYDETKNESYYKNLTYVEVNDFSQYKERKYYYIKGVIIQSGNVIFTLELDLWQTYVNYATFNLTTITSSNKKVGNGVYRNIEVTNGVLYDDYPLREEGVVYSKIEDKYVDIVFLLQYNVLQQVSGIGEDVVTKTALFSINTRETKDLLKVNSEDLDEYPSILLTTDVVSLIYGVSGGLFGTSTLDARVLKAWVVDNRKIKNDITTTNTSYSIKVLTKSSYYDPTATLNFVVKQVTPSIERTHIRIENYDINKAIVIGTFNNGLELQRFTNNDLIATYYTIVNTDDLKIIVQQGNQQKDITNAFEVPLTTNAETTTSTRAIAMSFKQLINGFERSISAYKNQGAVGVALTGAKAIGDAVKLTPNLQNSVGNGDGLLTFYALQYAIAEKGLLKSPYVITYTTSIYDEVKKALREGAVFNEVYEGNENILSYVLNLEYLQEVDDVNAYPCLIACQTNVEGVPLEARNVIKNKLSVGVYLSE